MSEQIMFQAQAQAQAQAQGQASTKVPDPGRGRRAVIAVLNSADKPLTLRQIRRAVRANDPDVAPSSVDDQLDVLIAEQRVAEINFGRAFELRSSSR